MITLQEIANDLPSPERKFRRNEVSLYWRVRLEQGLAKDRSTGKFNGENFSSGAICRALKSMAKWQVVGREVDVNLEELNRFC